MALRPRDTQIPRYIFLTNSQLCQHSLPYFLHEGRINLFDSDSSESANGHIITSQPRSSIRFSKQVNHISNVGRIQFHLCQTTVNHYQASSSHLFDENVVRTAGELDAIFPCLTFYIELLLTFFFCHWGSFTS